MSTVRLHDEMLFVSEHDLNKVIAERNWYRDALRRIAEMDYRGNRPEASVIAFRALRDIDSPTP